ncbi:MAG: tRNA (adenosine(37)-N6)-dimethylallyltransferase MiaA [Bacteroidales bacterium]|nr:tRNA (adenosine(37)-N6)-dimethylallyltransferase MiaA [Bacteroidales bacterium]
MTIPDINKPALVVVAGPTAVGKTGFAIELAQQWQCDIISADSRQFYREMRIGTAFPSDEELARVRHHFAGHLSIHDYYNASRFEEEVLALLKQLFKEQPVVIMTGGSSLYIDAVCYGIDDLPAFDPQIRKYVMELYDKEGIDGLRMAVKQHDSQFYHNTDIANYKRLMRALEVSLQTGIPYSRQLTQHQKERPFQIVKYCLTRPRESLFQRINQRVDGMMNAGLLEEARSLYPYKELNALNTVGYKELFACFDGQLSLEQAVEDIKTHTRRYAKRQLAWVKRDGGYLNYEL